MYWASSVVNGLERPRPLFLSSPRGSSVESAPRVRERDRARIFCCRMKLSEAFFASLGLPIIRSIIASSISSDFKGCLFLGDGGFILNEHVSFATRSVRIVGHSLLSKRCISLGLTSSHSPGFERKPRLCSVFASWAAQQQPCRRYHIPRASPPWTLLTFSCSCGTCAGTWL